MIIDAHTHLGNPGGAIVATVDDLVRSMDEAGIDKSLVLAGRINGITTAQVLDATRPYRGRLHTVASFSPPHAYLFNFKEFERGLASGDICGLKLYPGYEPFYPNDAGLRDVIQRLLVANKPIILHSGDTYSGCCKTARLKYALPIHVDDLAVDYPDLKIVIAHMGYPWERDAAEVVYKNKNVYVDCSGFVYGDFTGQSLEDFGNMIKTYRTVRGLPRARAIWNRLADLQPGILRRDRQNPLKHLPGSRQDLLRERADPLRHLMETNMTDLEELAETLGESDLSLIVTGAGVSLASGIPTFRGTDPGAVWKKDVTELATLRYFCESPEGSWSWYLDRFDKVFGAKPNVGHQALVEIESKLKTKKKELLLVTRNIDGLHRQAGSKNLVEVHGSAEQVRCVRQRCHFGAPGGSLLRDEIDLTAFRAEPVRRNVPLCPDCQHLLRPHILWFDEYYTDHWDYQWDRVTKAASKANLVVFIGTSLSVGVTSLINTSAQSRYIPIFNLDPAGEEIPGVRLIKQASEEVLPQLAKLLG